MNKQQEALKLALEALEYLRKPIAQGWEAETQQEKRDQAITATREALAEQPAPATELREQQEPVCDKDPRGCWSVRCQLGKVCKNTSPQPSKPWVGLTDEDTRKINQEVWGYVSADHTRMWEYARAIEAKLRDKNA